tara:strand:+ start:561 stop:671 length:111 start_codon:yes stop_codon:yes gene_type:complete
MQLGVDNDEWPKDNFPFTKNSTPILSHMQEKHLIGK